MKSSRVPQPRSQKTKPILIALTCVFALSACWIIPLRLMRESWYTFGYIGDEYLYAQRVQPLIDGTTATNSINGVCDPAIQSPFFLEDSVRAILTAARIDVITFVWLWKWLFPLVFGALFYVLACACLERRCRIWNATLRWAALTACFPLLYCVYDVVTPFPPLQGFINRFPTNIEYPLSVLLAAFYLFFLRNPTERAGVLLALISAGVAYLRPYLAFPWSLTIISGFIYLIATRKVSARVVIITALVLLVAMIPFIFVSRSNGQSPVFAEFFRRYFGKPGNYEVHNRWWLFAGLGFVLLGGSILLEPARKIFAMGAGFTLLLLPFICSLMPFASEVMQYDRFGSFYLVALISTAMLALNSLGLSWKGHAGADRVHRFSSGLMLLSLPLSGILAYRNAVYDFAKYDWGPIPSIRQDLAYIPAYTWVRANTPADSLFLVDDGFDWSIDPQFTPTHLPIMRTTAPDGSPVILRDDLFQIVTRRRRVYTERLTTCTLATRDLIQLGYLQRGTFGLPVPPEKYTAPLLHFRPNFILWKKASGAPVPRGHGSTLRAQSETVYSDPVCEIWKINYPP